MKKLVTMLCLAVLTVSTMFAATATFSQSASLEANGNYGAWRFTEANRAVYNPKNGYISTIYRKNYSAYAGLSISVGPDMDNLVQSDAQPSMSVSYPAGAMCDNYYFAVWGQKDAAGSLIAVFAAYDIDEGEWSAITPLPGYVGKYTGAYLNQGDVVKDADGNYVFIISSHTADADGEFGIVLFRGVTSDPVDADSWTWTEVLRTESTYFDDPKTQGVSMRIVAGSDGNIIVANDMVKIGEGDEAKEGFGYFTSSDYGETWNVPSVEGKWSRYNIQDLESITSGMGKSIYVADSTGVITTSEIVALSPMSSGDFNIDEDGNLYYSQQVYAESETALSYYDVDGKPVSGYYLYKGTKNGDTYSWKTSTIVPSVGVVKGSSTKVEDYSGDGTYGTYGTDRLTGISVGADGFVAFQVNDRYIDNPIVMKDVFGTSMSYGFKYYTNPYMVFSDDKGENWDFAPFTGENMYYGYNVTEHFDTSDNYFKVAKKAESLGSGAWNVYAGYGIPNLEEIIKDTSTGWTEIGIDVRVAKIDVTNISTIDGINEDLISSPKAIDLAQNYPNPFNPTTTISFKFDQNAKVVLNVFNANGQLVKNLVNTNMTAGLHSATFNAADLNSGVYFYKLNVNGNSVTKKMVLTK